MGKKFYIEGIVTEGQWILALVNRMRGNTEMCELYKLKIRLYNAFVNTVTIFNARFFIGILG